MRHFEHMCVWCVYVHVYMGSREMVQDNKYCEDVGTLP